MSNSFLKSVLILGTACGVCVALAAAPAGAFPKPKYPTSQTDADTPASSKPDSSRPPVKSAASSAPKPAAKAAPASSAPVVAQSATPVPLPIAAGAKGWSIYVVQRGDTLSGVSRRFGEPVSSLADLNEVDPKIPLKAGSKLKLPPGTADRGKDPYASGASPMNLANVSGTSTGGDKPKPVRVAQASSHPPATPKAEVDPLRRSPPSAPAVETPPPRSTPVKTTPPPVVSPPETLPLAADAQSVGRGRFVWPVRGDILSRFGPLAAGERNDGVNIAAGQGAQVRAAASGEVVYAGSDVKGYGNVVLIKHAGGWDTVYAHLGAISVRMRDHVEQGQAIGSVGQTGGVDRPQLHFETRFSGSPKEKHRPVDPMSILPQ